MTQAVNVRPGTVTAAQVIIWVLCAFSALGSALLVVLGIIGLVSGASVAASAAGSDASELGAGIGGLIGFFSGGLLVIGVISLVFVGLWFWIAAALGRASKPARIVLTIFCAIDLLWGVIALVGSLAEREGAPLLGGVLLLAIPATLMALVWGSEASRRFFDGVPSAYSPAPMSPPVGFAQPQHPMGQGPMSTRRPGWAARRSCRRSPASPASTGPASPRSASSSTPRASRRRSGSRPAAAPASRSWRRARPSAVAAAPRSSPSVPSGPELSNSQPVVGPSRALGEPSRDDSVLRDLGDHPLCFPAVRGNHGVRR